MFRLLLLVLISLWGGIQVFIGLDVPSSKSVHYNIINNYGMQALRMNQKKVVIGVSPNMYHSIGGVGNPDNNSSESGFLSSAFNRNVEIHVSSDVHTNPKSLLTTKNTPVFSANYLDELARQEHIPIYVETESPSNIQITAQENLQTEVQDENKARHLAVIQKLSQTVTTQITKSTKSAVQEINPIAFGFGVEASSLIGQLEAAQESVSQELAQSDQSAKAHTNIAVRMPFAPEAIAHDAIAPIQGNAQIQENTNFAISQKQSLVFEAQATSTATGGLNASQDRQLNATAATSSFEVGLASHAAKPNPSAAITANIAPAATTTPTIPSSQTIASNLTDTSTTVVSGLEITLNPNAAVRRETPAEKQAFLWPLPTRGRLTSGYGNRVLAITNNHFHQGIDIAVKSGTPILAVKDAIVEKAGWEGSYGYAVYLRHNDGTETRYAHMSRVIVEEGEWVNQGQWLGLVGSTGLSTGPHLHFELHLSGNAVDPSKHLVFSGERLATR